MANPNPNPHPNLKSVKAWLDRGRPPLAPGVTATGAEPEGGRWAGAGCMAGADGTAGAAGAAARVGLAVNEPAE